MVVLAKLIEIVASIVSTATPTPTATTATGSSSTSFGTTSTGASNGAQVTPPAANENFTVLNGWLHKKGARGMVKGFKKRWFSLQKDSRLVYYEAQDESKEKGHIDIRKVNSIAPCGAFGKQPRVTTFEFRIKTATREYILVALNEKDMWYWINGLNSVRQKNLLKSMNLTTSGTSSSSVTSKMGPFHENLVKQGRELEAASKTLETFKNDPNGRLDVERRLRQAEASLSEISNNL